ncbi:MAG: AAA family ATPase [Polyangiaceae bacterium]|nr:AAA family ATPase [Polyangiaceae bacterium]
MTNGHVVAGRFEVERVAASGGMGVVYRARDLQMGGPVALKVLRPGGVLDVERFEREAGILAGLRHPGIVAYIAHGATPEGERWLVMEWLDGESLAERLVREGLSVTETVSLGLRVASALAAAHRGGVVHRDLKPSNLFLPGRRIDAVKLIDFGVAHAPAAWPSITLSGAMLGTPGYMAPEQARGERVVDARADVFALGCVLFKCLTGVRPFRGDQPMAVLLKVVLEEAPRAGSLRSGVPAALDELIARMLSKDPEHRPSDADAVALALSHLAGLVSEDRPRADDDIERDGALSDAEQRVACVVLSRPVALDPREAETLIDGGAEAPAWSAQMGHAVHPRVCLPAWKAVVEPHGGALSLLADGSLLVTVDDALGGCRSATAATDTAAQAARCALALSPLLAGAPVAIVAGKTMISRGQLRRGASPRVPMGDVIDRGVRLLSGDPCSHEEARRCLDPKIRAAAVRGRIVVDDVVAPLLDGVFNLRAEGGLRFLAGELEEPGAPRTLLGCATECVGRERELDHLISLFDACVAEPAARAVFITGPTGIGKSRLRRELIRALRVRGAPVEVWLARGHPLGARTPHSLIAAALRRAAGILDADPDDLRRRKLLARVHRHVPLDGAPRIARLLGELAGIPASPDATLPGDDRARLADEVRRAFETFIAAECAVRPLILVLEDLHWADPASIQLIDALLRHLEDCPLLVLALASPEVHELFPRLWWHRPIDEIALAPLPRAAADSLTRAALGDQANPALIDRILDRAGGNPFALEELIRAAAAGDPDRIPPSLLAMVETRLESLDGAARRVLRAASIFGRVFWRGALFPLLGLTPSPPHDLPNPEDPTFTGERDLDATLADLIDREILAVRPTSRFPGEQELAFRSPLVRDTVYSMLTEPDARLGHRLAAAWLTAHGEPDLALSEHLTLSREPSEEPTRISPS